MPRLVVEKGRHKGKFLFIDKTSAVVVGRGSTADMQIDDPMTSRRHFSVEFKNGRYHIADLGSANGTYVNGEQVPEKVLAIGDRVECGEVLLSFLADESTIKHDTVTGQKIAGYLIEERVGRGAMGTVYKATQLSLDRTVALKILARELVKDKNFIDMFLREAQNAGQLNHPNIVQVYDVGNYNDIYFISMEFMTGGSVYELLNREGAQPFEKAIQIALHSARGLQYAERKHIVHRDIKPDNLMLMGDSMTKIGDLGIARRLQPGSTIKEEGIFGSPHYMAPEQAQGLGIDCRTDIYSLGATMHHVLTGKTPFAGKSPQEIILKQINKQPEKLLDVNPMAHQGLAEVVEKCMSKNPDDRFQSSSELLEVLENLEKNETAARAAVSFQDRIGILKKKYLFPAIVVLIAAIAASTGFLVYRGRQHSSLAQQIRLQEAKDALAEARSLFGNGEYEAVLSALVRLKEGYGEFAEVIKEADSLASDVAGAKEDMARRERETKAGAAFEEAGQFLKDNPRKLKEALEKYEKVAADFPGTQAAANAAAEQRRLTKIIEAAGKLEHAARAQANSVVASAERFRERKRYGKALEEIACYPEEYNATKAATDVENEKQKILSEANRAFRLTREEVEDLIRKKRYQDARSLLIQAVGTYEVRKFTDEADKILARIASLVKAQQQEEEKAELEEDKRRFDEILAKARSLILEHRFESAAAEYQSLQLLLGTDEYRNRAQVKVKEVGLIKKAMNTLINQINRKGLARQIKITRNKMTAIAVHANADKMEVRFEGRVGGADYFWNTFSAAEMASFLQACKLDAGGSLAAGVYAKELGDNAGARQHFEQVLKLDSTLRAEVEKYSKDLK